MRRPCADREEKRVTHGRDMNKEREKKKRNSLTPTTPIREDSQKLADILNTKVIAPNNIQWYYLNTDELFGLTIRQYETESIGPQKNENTSQKITFCPGGICN